MTDDSSEYKYSVQFVRQQMSPQLKRKGTVPESLSPSPQVHISEWQKQILSTWSSTFVLACRHLFFDIRQGSLSGYHKSLTVKSKPLKFTVAFITHLIWQVCAKNGFNDLSSSRHQFWFYFEEPGFYLFQLKRVKRTGWNNLGGNVTFYYKRNQHGKRLRGN